MKLGIDFGTNRTVVAAADRGNYPLTSFENGEGTAADWVPSLVAVRGDERRYGWDAWDVQTDDSWTVIRSIKRLLEHAGPSTWLDVGEQTIGLAELFSGFTRALETALRERSNLHLAKNEVLEAFVGVPAHANTNQRFLTVDAFRMGGFRVLGVLNEASAASIEFGHRQRQTKNSAETILVYDLGGGTFDCSLVRLDEHVHHVTASEGISTIGGDDFDQILADMALDGADISAEDRESMPAAAWFRLIEECRLKKEGLNPNSRRIVIDFDAVNPEWKSVQLPVADFYELARPLMEETIAVAEELVARHGGDQFEALYITGGASELPLVARVLRERFGRRVRRSTYARSATAIGLAIQAANPDSYRLSDTLTRNFGVWRESDGGARITFDVLFDKGVSLPSIGEPPLEITRSYTPAHNVGHFRFLECSHRAADGSPTGEVTLWNEIQFPFDPALEAKAQLDDEPVVSAPQLAGQQIVEHYRCDATGSLVVSVENKTAGYSRTYPLGEWQGREERVKPGRKRASR